MVYLTHLCPVTTLCLVGLSAQAERLIEWELAWVTLQLTVELRCWIRGDIILNCQYHDLEHVWFQRVVRAKTTSEAGYLTFKVKLLDAISYAHMQRLETIANNTNVFVEAMITETRQPVFACLVPVHTQE